MFELIALAVALIGGFAAGLWDLKTTDIPDEAPMLMAATGLFLWYVGALTTGNWQPFILSALLGTAVFAIGWALYKAGQWGGGDAALLAGIVYLMPSVVFLFDYVFNFFIVALVYVVIYSIALGFANPAVFARTANEVKKKRFGLVMLAWVILSAAAMVALTSAGVDVASVGLMMLAVLGLVLFSTYARVVERSIFRRSIQTSKLRVGDVLAHSRQWAGVTDEQIGEIRSKRKIVDVKEGVRFGLVFPLALVVTLLFGNVMFWFVGLF